MTFSLEVTSGKNSSCMISRYCGKTAAAKNGRGGKTRPEVRPQTQRDGHRSHRGHRTVCDRLLKCFRSQLFYRIAPMCAIQIKSQRTYVAEALGVNSILLRHQHTQPNTHGHTHTRSRATFAACGLYVIYIANDVWGYVRTRCC